MARSASCAGELCRDLAERKVELVITRVTESLIEENMSVETLFDDEYLVVAAKQNPWARRRRIELAQLMNEPWTLAPPDSVVGAFAISAFRACGLKPPPTTVVTLSVHMRHRLLATGRFLTITSGFMLRLPGKHPSLTALPIELPNARGAIAIITLKNRSLSPLAELFIKTARAVTKPLVKK